MTNDLGKLGRIKRRTSSSAPWGGSRGALRDRIKSKPGFYTAGEVRRFSHGRAHA